jgi:hypothetical protein
LGTYERDGDPLGIGGFSIHPTATSQKHPIDRLSLELRGMRVLPGRAARGRHHPLR